MTDERTEEISAMLRAEVEEPDEAGTGFFYVIKPKASEDYTVFADGDAAMVTCGIADLIHVVADVSGISTVKLTAEVCSEVFARDDGADTTAINSPLLN